MLFKTVKEYGQKSKRQRIDINKTDEIDADTKVIIFTEDEYKDFKQEVLDLQTEVLKLKSENNAITKINESYENQENNLKQIVEDVTNPIHEHYKKELKKKDDKIKELQTKLDAVEYQFNQYNLELNGLNGIEMVLLRRHKPMIKQYSATINTIIKSEKVDNNIVDADANSITGEEADHSKN